jgi:hypothetical protein
VTQPGADDLEAAWDAVHDATPPAWREFHGLLSK